MSQPDEEKVIFRFPEGFARLAAKARERGMSPNILAREFCKIALDRGWADGLPADPTPPIDEMRALIRKACFTVIVALSPEMDEAATERFLSEVFDA